MAAGSEEGQPNTEDDYDMEQQRQNESPMELESAKDSEMKPSSSLQLMLASIAEERSKEFTSHKLISDGELTHRSKFIYLHNLTSALVNLKSQCHVLIGFIYHSVGQISV